MRIQGYSLVELLTVLAIAGVLVGLAAPTWQRRIATAAVEAAADQTLVALALARRTALATGRATTLCLSADLARCSLAGREWMLFSNDAGGAEARREPGEALLRRIPLPRSVRVSGTRGYATYQPLPRAATTLTFKFCHPAYPELRRSVVVSQTGRPRLDRLVSGRRAECIA